MNKENLVALAASHGIKVTEMTWGIFNPEPAYRFEPVHATRYQYRENMYHKTRTTHYANPKIKFTETVTACGSVYRAEFKKCRLEMGLDKTWLHIIDADSACEICIIDDDGDVISDSGEVVTSDWTEADWKLITEPIGVKQRLDTVNI